MDYSKDIAKENRKKYLNPPTIELIDSIVKSHNVKEAQFERFFGLPPTTIAHIRNGYRQMPAKFWHLFFTDVTYEISKPKAKKVFHISMSKPLSKKKNKPNDSHLNRLWA